MSKDILREIKTSQAQILEKLKKYRKWNESKVNFRVVEANEFDKIFNIYW